jgi:dethiobiotin synthetase
MVVVAALENTLILQMLGQVLVAQVGVGLAEHTVLAAETLQQDMRQVVAVVKVTISVMVVVVLLVFVI